MVLTRGGVCSLADPVGARGLRIQYPGARLWTVK